MNTKKYTSSFCSSIDQLLEAWNTAGKYNYDNIHPNEPGNKANYFAIKLGLTTLDRDLPYNSDKWLGKDTVEETKEKYPDIPAELKLWKQKAKALDSNTELFTLSFDTDISKTNIKKFLRLADEAMDLIKYPVGSPIPGQGPISNKGHLLNEFALKLGLIDADWYLAIKCGLDWCLDFKSVGLQQVPEPNLKLYKELQIDVNCNKLPFITTGHCFDDGDLDEDRLHILVEEAKALLDDQSDNKVNAQIEPIALDEKRYLAYADGGWHKITPRALEIIRKLNEEPGIAYTGDDLKYYPNSSERPDKIIGRLPKAISDRITNTPQHGYHII